MSITQEISRLYRKGKTPKPFISTLITQRTMMLYLSNKYKINNPKEEQIREQYKKYGRDIRHLRPLNREPPVIQNDFLQLYYDDKDNLLRSNRDNYYSSLYWDLCELIEANPGKKIITTIDITLYKNNIPDCGHTEIIVYDPLLNILEHIDSNNVPKQYTRKSRGYFACSEIVSSIMRDIAKVLPQEPLYINNEDIYSRYEWGIQSLECVSDLITDSEHGYCLMWTTLFGDFALAYPEYSMKQIIGEIIKKSKSSSSYNMNDYLLLVIRGYVADLSEKLDVAFNDEISQHKLCSRLAFDFTKKKQK